MAGVVDELTEPLVHLSGVTPALGDSGSDVLRWAGEAASQGTLRLSFDVNFRASLWPGKVAGPTLRSAATQATVVFGSDEELALLHPDGPVTLPPTAAAASAPPAVDEAISSLMEAGVSEVVRKLGPEGAEVRAGGEVAGVPAVPVTVVDLIGAGDALASSYLSGRLDGLTCEASLHRGATLAAAAIAGIGDWEHLPTRADLGLHPGDTSPLTSGATAEHVARSSSADGVSS